MDHTLLNDDMTVTIQFKSLPEPFKNKVKIHYNNMLGNIGPFDSTVGVRLIKELTNIDVEYCDSNTGWFDDDKLILNSEHELTLFLLKL